MFGSAFLETAIGLFFFYALLALVFSALVEAIQAFLNSRGENLYTAITHLLPEKNAANGKLTAAELYTDPVIAGLGKQSPRTKKPRPSYIKPELFADIVLRKILLPKETSPTFQAISNESKTLANALGSINEASPLKPYLMQAMQKVQGGVGTAKEEYDLAHASVVAAYNDTMDRAQGWFKRQSQAKMLVISFILCALLNADTLYIANTLYTTPILREAVVTAAVQAADTNNGSPHGQTADGAQPTHENIAIAKVEEFKALQKELTDTFPLGWHGEAWGELCEKCSLVNEAQQFDHLYCAKKVLGILTTVLAVSLGAAFWFQLLSQITRLTGRRISQPEEQKQS